MTPFKLCQKSLLFKSSMQLGQKQLVTKETEDGSGRKVTI